MSKKSKKYKKQRDYEKTNSDILYRAFWHLIKDYCLLAYNIQSPDDETITKKQLEIFNNYVTIAVKEMAIEIGVIEDEPKD